MPTVDWDFYPHIRECIIDFALPHSLYTLRLVSRSFRVYVDHCAQTHLVFNYDHATPPLLYSAEHGIPFIPFAHEQNVPPRLNARIVDIQSHLPRGKPKWRLPLPPRLEYVRGFLGCEAALRSSRPVHVPTIIYLLEEFPRISIPLRGPYPWNWGKVTSDKIICLISGDLAGRERNHTIDMLLGAPQLLKCKHLVVVGTGAVPDGWNEIKRQTMDRFQARISQWLSRGIRLTFVLHDEGWFYHLLTESRGYVYGDFDSQARLLRQRHGLAEEEQQRLRVLSHVEWKKEIGDEEWNLAFSMYQNPERRLEGPIYPDPRYPEHKARWPV